MDCDKGPGDGMECKVTGNSGVEEGTASNGLGVKKVKLSEGEGVPEPKGTHPEVVEVEASDMEQGQEGDPILEELPVAKVMPGLVLTQPLGGGRGQEWKLKRYDMLEKKVAYLEEELEGKDEENRRLKERLGHFLKAYPRFEFNREVHLELLEEERVTLELVHELYMKVDQVYEEMQEKGDEVSRLTRRIDKLLREGKEPAVKVLSDSAGGRDAVSMLPEEVWRMILDNVTDHKDLWNCSHTCTLFKKILDDFWKPTWLFQQALPLLFRYLPQKQVLKCRLVSKGWNMMVDQYLESHPSLRPHTKEKDGFHARMLPFVTPVAVKGFENLNKFDFRGQWFRGDNPGFPYLPGRNPFLGRGVTMIIGLSRLEEEAAAIGLDFFNREWRVNNCKRVWDGTRSFLKTFGEHIWYLTVDTPGQLGEADAGFGREEAMLQLLTVDIPTLAPNLRKLRIRPFQGEDYTSLYEKIDIGAISSSPNLETIQADESHIHVGHPILLALIERNHSTIRSLHLNRSLWAILSGRNLEWPNLAELYLDHLYLAEPEDEPWVRKMPRLRKLGVNLRGHHNGFSWLLDLIHSFFGTAPLTTLRISGWISPHMLQPLRWRCCMSPTLKTLEVEHGEGDDNYNYAFLAHFPLVENVHVFVKRNPARIRNPRHPAAPFQLHNIGHWGRLANIFGNLVEPEEDENGGEGDVGGGMAGVTKYHFGGSIYQSDIWELLPRLKLFTFKWDKFTREGYERFKEKKNELEICFGEMKWADLIQIICK